jgi:hypothetical protein
MPGLNRRSQPGRYPLHRMSFADDFIEVVAIDALKHAPLESETRRLDGCQGHWSQTFGTGMGLNAKRLASNNTAKDGMMLT